MIVCCDDVLLWRESARLWVTKKFLAGKFRKREGRDKILCSACMQSAYAKFVHYHREIGKGGKKVLEGIFNRILEFWGVSLSPPLSFLFCSWEQHKKQQLLCGKQNRSGCLWKSLFFERPKFCGPFLGLHLRFVFQFVILVQYTCKIYDEISSLSFFFQFYFYLL